MKVKFFRALWGMEEPSLRDNLKKIKNGGFDGVELGPLWLTKAEKEMLPKFLEEFSLELIAQQYTWENKIEDHLKSFEDQFMINASLKPLFINSQTGKDHFSFEQNKAFIIKAEELSEKTGTKFVHETHRGRFNFCTTTTKIYLDAFPNLRLCADFSHWINVAESYLEDQAEIMEQAILCSDHIHSRVGFHQGPQVNDPRAPEWKEAVEIHLKWWDSIVNNHKKAGAEYLTITPEFGPWPYMPVLPFTQQPLTSLWDINLFMKDMLKERYT